MPFSTELTRSLVQPVFLLTSIRCSGSLNFNKKNDGYMIMNNCFLMQHFESGRVCKHIINLSKTRCPVNNSRGVPSILMSVTRYGLMHKDT